MNERDLLVYLKPQQAWNLNKCCQIIIYELEQAHFLHGFHPQINIPYQFSPCTVHGEVVLIKYVFKKELL